jgi:hypothetical protein
MTSVTSSVSIKKEEEKKQQEEIVRQRKVLKAYVQDSDYAYHLIMAALPQGVKNLMVGVVVGHAAGVWKILLEKFENSGEMNKLRLIANFHNMRMTDDQSWDAWKATVDDQVELLQSNGYKVQSDDYWAKLVYFLPTHYQNAVELALRVRRDAADAAQEIRTIFKNHEDALLASGMEEKANSAINKNKPERKQVGGDTRTCYKCGKPGHIIRNCPSRRKPQKEADSDTEQANAAVEDESEFVFATTYKSKVGQSVKISAQPAPAASSVKKVLIRPPEPSSSAAAPSSAASSSSKADSERRENRAALLKRLVEDDPRTSINKRIRFGYNDRWLIDTAASMHTTGNRNVINGLRSCAGREVEVANGTIVNPNRCGYVHLFVNTGKGQQKFTIQNVMFHEEFKVNLLSMGLLRQDGWGLEVPPNDPTAPCYLVSPKGLRIRLTVEGRLFCIRSVTREYAYAAEVSPVECALQLHHTLGHMHYEDMVRVMTSGKVNGLSACELKSDAVKNAIRNCIACVKGKGHRKPWSGTGLRKAKSPWETMHVDSVPVKYKRPDGSHTALAGPNGELIFSLTVDEYSDAWAAINLKAKELLPEKVVQLMKNIETQTGHKIREFHSDKGSELVNMTIKTYCNSKGIRMTMAPTDLQELNGIAERANRTVLEGARTILAHAGLPKNFWPYAVMAVVLVHNRAKINPRLGVTPYEAITGEKPNCKHLKDFGCDVYYHIPKKNRGKFDEKMRLGIHLGYNEKENAYNIYDIASRKVIVSRDVKFFEGKYSGAQKLQAGDYGDDVVYQDDETEIVPPQDDEELDQSEEEPVQASGGAPTEEKEESSQNAEPQASIPPEVVTTRSGRQVKQPPRGPFISNYMGDCEPTESREYVYSLVGNLNFNEPRGYKEAMRSPHADKWREAMKKEIDSLQSRGCWEIVDRPKGKNVIPSLWVLKVKLDSDGQIEKYKARCVAGGHRQIQGVDYDESSSPTLKQTAFKFALSFGAQMNLEIDQFDFTQAYINASLKEEVYMEQPEGFAVDAEHKVCRLVKDLYGLCQAGRDWNEELNNFLVNELHFVRSTVEPCMYRKDTKEGRKILLAIYVDDSQAYYWAADRAEWKSLFKRLCDKYQITDLGELKWILGMRVTRDRANRVIYLDQELYIHKLLERFRMDRCKPAPTPEVVGDALNTYPSSDDGSQVMTGIPYREIVGGLLYAAMCTRPDIAHAVHQLSKHCAAPMAEHWTAAKRVLRYLAGTAIYKLAFGAQKENHLPLAFSAHSDADFANDKKTRKSISGILVRMNGDLITWQCKQQTVVALSTCEAEYLAIGRAVQELLFLQNLSRDLQIEFKPGSIVYTDSQAAETISKADALQGRSKHIDIKYHFVRHHLVQGTISVQWVADPEQEADVMTKATNELKFTKMIKRLMVTTGVANNSSAGNDENKQEAGSKN